MANTDPAVISAAQLAYQRSNVSINEYNPANVADEDKVRDGNLNRRQPLEPVLTRAENVEAPAPAAEAPAKPAK